MNIQFDNNNSMSFVSISPIQALFCDTINCTKLYLALRDNLYCTASIMWHLSTDNGEFRISNHEVIEGSDYSSWTGDSEFLFTFVAIRIGVTITE